MYIESHAIDEKDYLFWKYDKLKDIEILKQDNSQVQHQNIVQKSVKQQDKRKSYLKNMAMIFMLNYLN